MRNRDIARAVLIAFAESERPCFAPSGFYDDDGEIMDEICENLGVKFDNKFRQRVFRVCNQLCHVGILAGQMVGTQKYYLGEPAKQREFFWANPSYAARIHSPPRRYNHTVLGPVEGPKFELERLLDKAYEHSH